MPPHRRYWLCVPPLVLFGCDVGLTLAGQPASYWQGDYDTAREGNPLAWLVLAWHPLAFAALIVGYALGIASVLTLWRHPLTVVLSFLLTLGHAVGAASWLALHDWLGFGVVAAWLRFAAAVLLLIAAERLLAFCWRRARVIMT